MTEFEVGERLDKAVAVAYPEYSRSSIEKLIEAGDILVNGKPVKAKYKLKSADKITTDFSSLTAPIADIELTIIYEDENVVVINKPAGILAHSKGTFNLEPTVASWLKSKYGDNSDFWQNNRAGIVHRLDRATSGVMICAKTQEAQKFLQKQFARRNVKKTYLALVERHLKEQEAIIKLPIERNPKKPQTFRIGANGKPAETYYRVRQRFTNNDLVDLMPRTGRTHQLRVHMTYLGHPIVNDHVYSKLKPRGRMFLHAAKLEITLPHSERRVFEAPLPNDLQQILDELI